MPFEVKPKREGANHVFLRKNVPDRGNSECKCPEEGMSPGFSDGQKEADARITEQVKAEGGERSELGACPVEPIGLPPP